MTSQASTHASVVTPHPRTHCPSVLPPAVRASVRPCLRPSPESESPEPNDAMRTGHHDGAVARPSALAAAGFRKRSGQGESTPNLAHSYRCTPSALGTRPTALPRVSHRRPCPARNRSSLLAFRQDRFLPRPPAACRPHRAHVHPAAGRGPMPPRRFPFLPLVPAGPAWTRMRTRRALAGVWGRAVQHDGAGARGGLAGAATARPGKRT